MATLLERISDLAHFTRTPSLTDTDDSAPSDDLSDPPAISESPVDEATTMKHPLLRSTSKTSHATTRMRSSSVSSTLMLRFQRPLVVALTESQVLGCLLRYLSWHEFRNLVGTSRAVRDALDTEASMDRILTRFVPAYRLGVRPDDQMRISLDDLESFMLSQHTSLHLYPTHALSVIDSFLNMMHLASSTTERFQGLTAAHSKFVLLLRSRALAAPHPPEVDDQPPTPPPVVPQLVFPAPLFFAQPKNTTSTSAPATLTKQGSQRRASLTSLLSLSRSSSRRKPIPPPAPQPRASISVSFNKRSSTYLSRSYNPPARSKSTPPQTHTDDDLSVLKPPRPWCRRHSSLPGSSASSSRGSLAAVSEKASRLGSGPLLPTGPHDLLYAAVPGRAPILRVFVPTDVLSPESIRACEMLLYRAGLWEWMKPGDIVCNLGYVPREESNANSPVDQFGRFQSNEVRQTEWLVFTGSALIPYFPPAPPPPDIDILSLPGPAYYSHLATPGPTHLHLPGLMDEPSMAVAGLVYALSIPKRSTEPSMRLDSGVGYVKSSRGITRVSRAVWIASFIVDKPRHGRKGKSKSTLADEWTGEWVLEGMGTREGERGLRDAMDDGQVRFWEWVREKSGPGRIWLRLLDAPVLGVTEPVPPVPPIPANLSA